MAGGYDRLSPSRKVVDEIISNGSSLPTGITGLTSRQYTTRFQSWATPRPPSSSVFVMALTVSSSNAVTTVTTGLTNPDYPRAVKIAPTTSQAATGNVVISGTNQWGVSVTDTIALGGTGAPVNGAKAFKTISSVVLPASTSGTGTQASFSLAIGLSGVFGLDRQVPTVAACIRAAVNGTAETTAPILNTTNHTASFSTAATSSAGALVEILYMHGDMTNS